MNIHNEQNEKRSEEEADEEEKTERREVRKEEENQEQVQHTMPRTTGPLILLLFLKLKWRSWVKIWVWTNYLPEKIEEVGEVGLKEYNEL